MKNEEINALVANEIRQMELEGIFSDEHINKIKEQIFQEISKENKLVEQEEVIADPEVSVDVPIAASELPVSTYEPTLPSFIDKIEPAKFVVFDRNELSVGGENLSNKPFRTLEDPDKKISIHQEWVNNGKKRADVYIAKLVKIGEIEFDYTNGTSQYIEKRDEIPALNSNDLEMNPFENQVPLQIVDDGSVEPARLDATNLETSEIENKVREYIKTLVGNNFPKQNEITPEIVVKSVNESSEASVKMRDLITNEKTYKKIPTPDAIKKSMDEGVDTMAYLKHKDEQVQIWVLEGVEYYLPTDIISNKKCYTKKSLL